MVSWPGCLRKKQGTLQAEHRYYGNVWRVKLRAIHVLQLFCHYKSHRFGLTKQRKQDHIKEFNHSGECSPVSSSHGDLSPATSGPGRRCAVQNPLCSLSATHRDSSALAKAEQGKNGTKPTCVFSFTPFTTWTVLQQEKQTGARLPWISISFFLWALAMFHFIKSLLFQQYNQPHVRKDPPPFRRGGSFFTTNGLKTRSSFLELRQWRKAPEPNLLYCSGQNPAATLSIGSILLLSKGSSTLEEFVTSLDAASLQYSSHFICSSQVSALPSPSSWSCSALSSICPGYLPGLICFRVPTFSSAGPAALWSECYFWPREARLLSAELTTKSITNLSASTGRKQSYGSPLF